MTSVALRLPDGLFQKLKAITKQLNTSKSHIIRKALEIYIKEYVDYQIALGRLNDKDDEIVSSKDMRKLLEK